jgi:hypothetical protein
MWKLLRAQVWMMPRMVSQGPLWQRVVKLAVLLVLGGALVWMYTALVAIFRAGEGLFTLASFVPTALVMLLFFLLSELADTLRRLFLSSDMDLLMAAPIPAPLLYLQKLLLCSQSLWIPALFLGGILLALGQGMRAPLLYYPLAWSLLLAVVVALTVLAMVLVSGLVRVVPPKRAISLVPVLLMLVSLSVMLVQPSLISVLGRLESLMEGLTAATVDVSRFAPLVGIAVGGASLLALLGYGVFVGTFYHGWQAMRSSTPKRRAATSSAGRQDVLATLVQHFPSPERDIVLKDWRVLFRSPKDLVGVFLIPLMVLALLFPSLKAGSALYPLRFWSVLFYGAMFMVNASQAAGVLAMAEEGRNFGLLRTSPVSPSRMLWAKFLAKWPPVVFAWSIMYILAGIVAHLALWQVAVLMLFAAWCLAGTTILGLAWGARNTRFNIENIKLRVPQASAWIALLSFFIFVIFASLSFAAGILQLAPQAQLVLDAKGALSFMPKVAWVFEPSGALLIVAGLAGQALMGALAWWLWQGTVRHLETWEIE